MLLYDGVAAHTYVARLFILERKGIALDVQQVDIMNMENRRLQYRTQVNTRGEIPALQLDDGTVVTDSWAICQYLDEIATGGRSLFGTNSLERATVMMWLRRTDLEIVQPLLRWYRNGPETVDFYRGNRVPIPEAQLSDKVTTNQGLNLLDDHFDDGRVFICGEQLTMPDVWVYSILKLMGYTADWLNPPGRTKVAAWMKRMDERPSTQAAMKTFDAKLSV